MKVEGSRPEFDGQVMKMFTQPNDFMPNKYGQKMRPYEISMKLAKGGENKIEYFYSLKSFEKETSVAETEPFRVLHIQDPFTYRGELAFNKSSVQRGNKVWIVNGKIERADGNFMGGFFFNRVKKTNIIFGSCPLNTSDMEKI
jgi:hypothetical protein